MDGSFLPDDLVDNAEKIAQNLFISAPTPNQYGALAAFDCYDEFDAHLPRYQDNRDRLLAGLPAEFLGQHAPADGAFYLYVDIGAISNNAGDFARRMLHEAGVAVTPGIDFDQTEGGVTCACPMLAVLLPSPLPLTASMTGCQP